MRLRTDHRLLAATVAASLASVGLSWGLAGPAQAADPDDASFVPVAADLVGVGSATSQHLVHVLAEGPGSWGAQSPAPTYRIASFAATGGGTLGMPSGQIGRPDGTNAGKLLLYGATNNAGVDFARASSAQTPTETAAGLQSIPFALDSVGLAVSNAVPSHAPASLTAAQIVGIYNGSITSWATVGGTAGTVKPMLPPADSGTRGFFLQQLQSMNGGVAVTLAPGISQVQEQDATLIKSDADAITPFSIGRATLLGAAGVRIETGWKADRALYNVVRGAELTRADIQAVLGSNGFFCSTAARSLVEASGFKQLATPARGGVCGAATQGATTNFTLNQGIITTTTLAASSSKARHATLVAKVTGATAAPTGTISFYDGTKLLASGVHLVAGQATRQIRGLGGGTHAFKAVFVPSTGSLFDGSQSAVGQVLVRTISDLSESFAPQVRMRSTNGKVVGNVSVRLVGSTTLPTGKVVLSRGQAKLGRVALTNGKARFAFKVSRLKLGKNTLTASWHGDANAEGGSLTFSIRRARP